MLEDDLRAAAERVAPPVDPDLAASVLARVEQPSPIRRRWVALAAVVVTALVGLGLSPQVRAFAAELLALAGIEVTSEEPDAPRTPAEPLPETRESDLEQAADAATFPLAVPARLGGPPALSVSDGGRVVTMRWRDGRVVLDQFDGRFGPVFSKQVGDRDPVPVAIGDGEGFWFPVPHDLLYVDRDGDVVSATARLSGRTLVWEDAGVSYRLEGRGLTQDEAVAIAESLEGTP